MPKIRLPEDGTNGISDEDFSFDQVPEPPELFEFTCNRREKLAQTTRYYVLPVGEYEDLDFAGHDVLINGVKRRCANFEVEDGHIVIVTENDPCQFTK